MRVTLRILRTGLTLPLTVPLPSFAKEGPLTARQKHVASVQGTSLLGGFRTYSRSRGRTGVRK